jgi:hypothetical protein
MIKLFSKHGKVTFAWQQLAVTNVMKNTPIVVAHAAPKMA